MLICKYFILLVHLLFPIKVLWCSSDYCFVYITLTFMYRIFYFYAPFLNSIHLRVGYDLIMHILEMNQIMLYLIWYLIFIGFTVSEWWVFIPSFLIGSFRVVANLIVIELVHKFFFGFNWIWRSHIHFYLIQPIHTC